MGRNDRFVTPLIRQIAEGILGLQNQDSLMGVPILPSEQELSQQFGVSRGSIRSALLHLIARGFIVRLPNGRSSFMPPRSADSTVMVFTGEHSATKEANMIREGLLACSGVHGKVVQFAPIEALPSTLANYSKLP